MSRGGVYFFGEEEREKEKMGEANAEVLGASGYV